MLNQVYGEINISIYKTRKTKVLVMSRSNRLRDNNRIIDTLYMHQVVAYLDLSSSSHHNVICQLFH